MFKRKKDKKPREKMWLRKVGIVEPYCKAQVKYKRTRDCGQTVFYSLFDKQFSLSKEQVYSLEVLVQFYEKIYAELPGETPYVQLFKPRFCPDDYHYVNPSGKHGIQIIRWEKYLELRGIDASSNFKFKFVN